MLTKVHRTSLTYLWCSWNHESSFAISLNTVRFLANFLLSSTEKFSRNSKIKFRYIGERSLAVGFKQEFAFFSNKAHELSKKKKKNFNTTISLSRPLFSLPEGCLCRQLRIWKTDQFDHPVHTHRIKRNLKADVSSVSPSLQRIQTSAFEFLHGGQVTLSTQSINQSFCVSLA